MTERTLVIGNKNYSSWSLRPWLFLRKNEIGFSEQQLWLDVAEFKPAIKQYASGGKVPVWIDGDLQVWDSLAIIEMAIDLYQCPFGWPDQTLLRAHARSACCEMHSSFIGLRSQCPMDIRGQHQLELSSETLHDIERITALWEQAMEMSGNQGRWLYGDFSAADAMFAPVVFRLLSYGVEVSDTVQAYLDFVTADPQLKEWVAAAEAEQAVIEL